MRESQKRAIAKYRRDNMHKITLAFYKKDAALYEAIQKAAALAGIGAPLWIRDQLRHDLIAAGLLDPASGAGEGGAPGKGSGRSTPAPMGAPCTGAYMAGPADMAALGAGTLKGAAEPVPALAGGAEAPAEAGAGPVAELDS